jgi:hypothetical protein
MSYLTEAKEMLREIEHDLHIIDNKNERTIRHVATNIAILHYYNEPAREAYPTEWQWWEAKERTERFRKHFPTLKDYLRGRVHMPDGSIQHWPPGWRYHVKLARMRLVQMMGDETKSDAVREGSYEAICEDREKEYKYGGHKLLGAFENHS